MKVFQIDWRVSLTVLLYLGRDYQCVSRYTIAFSTAFENEQSQALFVCVATETNAVLYCSQVTAGDGHSWKGSVVSDTVKRGCSSVPMVPVQRQGAHSQPSIGKGKHFYLCYS